MKVSFTLEPYQKHVLLVLRETGQIPFHILKKLLDVISDSEFDLRELVRILSPSRKFEFIPQWQEREDTKLKTTIEGLIFVGLVESSTSLGTPFHLVRPDARITDSEIGLTEDGERIAKAIAEERRLILRPVPIRRTTVFVACAFGHEEIDLLYDKHLLPACAFLHYEPVRGVPAPPRESPETNRISTLPACRPLGAGLWGLALFGLRAANRPATTL